MKKTRVLAYNPLAENKTGFTLIEILCVLAIIAVLAALLFPVFGRVREKSRQASCASNLRQIGAAISLYAQDSDNIYPLASDTVSPAAFLWSGLLTASRPQQVAFDATQPLKTLLAPYTKNATIWRCPSDMGGCDQLPLTSTDLMSVSWEPCSEIHASLGTSYFYRARLGVEGIRFPAEAVSNGKYLGASEAGVMTDGRPTWHGDPSVESAFDSGSRRYNILFADGHVKLVKESDFVRAWLFDVKAP